MKYRQLIDALQYLHFPLNARKLSNGTRSHAFRGLPHSVQWDPGSTNDSPLGSRHIQTFRKLPTTVPSIKASSTAAQLIIVCISHLYCPPPALRFVIMASNGWNIAITINPTIVPSITIIIGSIADVRLCSEASTSDS